ncbi:formate--tetrahydrofolate ligase [Prunus yedoensis var. nudiflora]|uniref:Formate--tetrahydrofolate ligase n=1 Tax=Prunus yedoensis var. nudiflora TaxID=2094558 RepID=A0A314ZFF7_PRUYE|nr:formate--tetrahydrofolate ligase [Prunus yedoensis var. nudiflora]
MLLVLLQTLCTETGWFSCSCNYKGLENEGGGLEIVAGKPCSNACITENVALVEAGCANFGQAYISNTKVYGAGAYDAVICNHHAYDGRAAVSHFLPLVL